MSLKARDLVNPLRIGLRREDWQSHAEAIRDAVNGGADDHGMAEAMGTTRERMLKYAQAVPQFAAELHLALEIAKVVKGQSTRSITCAMQRVTKMPRYREGRVPLPLPRFMDPEAAEAHQEAQPSPVQDEVADPVRVLPEPAPAIQEGMCAADWKVYAREVIKVGQGGGSDYSMAAAIRVSRTDMVAYGKAVPAFNKALEYARTCARAWWEQRMIEAVFKDSGLRAEATWRGYRSITKTDDQGRPVDLHASRQRQ